MCEYKQISKLLNIYLYYSVSLNQLNLSTVLIANI